MQNIQIYELKILQFQIVDSVLIKFSIFGIIINFRSIFNINTLQKMETNQGKWRCFHQSAKNINQTQEMTVQRFRSSSKEHFNINKMQKGTRSLANLLLAPSLRQGSQGQVDPIEYYQVRGKQNVKKMEDYLRDSFLLKKQLSKIGENKPQNKVIIDSTITLIHNYELKIKNLQKQLAKLHQNAPQQHQNILKQNNNQNEVEIGSKKCFGSEKTVSSLSSIKKIKMVKTTSVPDYYFPSKGTEQ